MKVLMVEPGKAPYETEINSGLEALQAAVDGYIEQICPFEDPVAIICNEEGKLDGLPLNRALRGKDGAVYDIIAGRFLIVGLGEEDYTDLPAELMDKYSQHFKYPEDFFKLAGKIIALPIIPQEERGKPMKPPTQER